MEVEGRLGVVVNTVLDVGVDVSGIVDVGAG